LIELLPEERAAIRARYSLPQIYAVIKPTGKTTVTTKKEWGLEYFQQVVDAMPHINWVQPGLPEEPLLRGVLDARGGTTLRELFALVAESRFLLTVEGLYNHIGAAFNVPSFVVLSGHFYPESFTYPSTVMIGQEPQVACSPCFLDGHKDCPIPGKPCMADISPEKVVKAINEKLLALQPN
jgi:ADP-heptose:LPS heptosyltransferase